MNRETEISKVRISTTDRQIAFFSDTIAGYILFIGVLSSVSLTVLGLAWHLVTTRGTWIHYRIEGNNFAQFLREIAGNLISGTLRPEVLINAGIAILMMTPYIRLVFSFIYFVIKSNWKYAILTLICLIILTQSFFFN